MLREFKLAVASRPSIIELVLDTPYHVRRLECIAGFDGPGSNVLIGLFPRVPVSLGILGGPYETLLTDAPSNG